MTGICHRLPHHTACKLRSMCLAPENQVSLVLLVFFLRVSQSLGNSLEQPNFIGKLRLVIGFPMAGTNITERPPRARPVPPVEDPGRGRDVHIFSHVERPPRARGYWKGEIIYFFSIRMPTKGRAVPPAEDPGRGRDARIERPPGPPRHEQFRRQKIRVLEGGDMLSSSALQGLQGPSSSARLQ